MGRVTVESEKIFTHSPETIYDFVSNPTNWAKTYKGAGTPHAHLTLPLKVGDTWTESVALPTNTYTSTWTLIAAVRPTRFVFQQVNGIGRKEAVGGEGEEEGVEGTVTIEYCIERDEEGKGTVFRRGLRVEVPWGVDLPDDLLVVCARPGGVDRYFEAVERELDLMVSEGGGGK